MKITIRGWQNLVLRSSLISSLALFNWSGSEANASVPNRPLETQTSPLRWKIANAINTNKLKIANETNWNQNRSREEGEEFKFWMEDSYIDYNKQNQKLRLVQYMQWFKTSLTNSPKQIQFLHKSGWFSFDIQTKKLLKNEIEGNNYLWISVGKFERSLKPPPKLTSLSWPKKAIIHLETEKSLSYFNSSGNKISDLKKKICLPIKFYVHHQKSLAYHKIHISKIHKSRKLARRISNII